MAWNFDLRGVVTIDIDDGDKAEELGLLAIDVGAEDIQIDEGVLEIFSPSRVSRMCRGLWRKRASRFVLRKCPWSPRPPSHLGDREAEQTLRLLDVLEELDDIQKAFTNADFPLEVLERYQAS